MKLGVFLLLTLLFVKVNNGFSQSYFYTECDSYLLDDFFKVNTDIEKETYRVFSENAFVYCGPSTDAEQLGSLRFNTKVTATALIKRTKVDSFITYSGQFKRYTKYTVNIKWLKIKYNHKEAFILYSDLADYYNLKHKFLLGQGGENQDYPKVIKAIKGNRNSHSVADSYGFSEMHGSAIEVIKNNGLQNSGTLICYETYRESCPGATKFELIVLKNSHFYPLLTSYSTGEVGTFDTEEVYLPILHKDGVVKLTPISHFYLRYNSSIQLDSSYTGFNYPKNIGVPLENLIVKTHSYTELILDKNGEPIMDKNDNFKVTVITESPTYYAWNGDKLRLIGAEDYISQIDSLTYLIQVNDSANNVLKNQIDSLKNSTEIEAVSTEIKPNKKPNYFLYFGLVLGGFFIGFILFKKRYSTKNP